MAVIGASSSLGGFAGGNALARLLVVFSGDTSSLERSVTRASGTIAGFEKQASAIGSAMTRTLTLPILAVGGASLFMAAEFESSIGRIAGLTPIVEDSGQSIESIRQRLLDLSQVVPTAPNELAKSLYFAGSAGLTAAEAFQVVELSAKGAAIGMGDAADISRVLIAAVNAWRPTGLSAAEAMDALTVAVREGTAEPAEMAIALGRLVPVAQEAGVTFQETVGALASLTNIGFPARVATTSLRALFAQLLAPTQQAQDRLEALGLTADDVRESLRFGGPINAFKLLDEAVQGDQDALRDLIPQIRGFSAYLGIADDRLLITGDIMGKTTNATGALQKALDIISKTPQFKFNIALNKMRVAAINLGSTLFPIFEKLIDFISAVADRFANLPKPLQKATSAFLLLLAAAGPLLKLFANLGLNTTLVGSFNQITTSALTLGGALLVLIGSFQSLSEGSTSLFSVMTTLASGALAAYSAMRLLQSVAYATNWNALYAILGLTTGQLGLLAVGIGVLVTAIGLAQGSTNKLKNTMAEFGDSMVEAAKGGVSLRAALKSIEDTDAGSRLFDLARDMKLLDRSASEVLDDLTLGIGEKFASELLTLDRALQATDTSTGQYALGLHQFVGVARSAALAGQDLGPMFKKSGLNGDDFLNLLEHINTTTAGVEPNIAALAGEVLELAYAYPQARQALKDYQNEQLAAITISQAEKDAVADYAYELGLGADGVDYLAGRLQDAGISALGMGDDVKRAFERAYFAVDKDGERISARVKMMQDAMAEAAADISESVAGSFSGFDKAEDNLKKSTSRLLTILQSNARAVVTEIGDLRELAARGVPADVLGFLADQGPKFVSRFVDASDSELRRLVAVYESQLAATDSAILAESLHQKTKGRNMVAQFTEGILSNDSLPPEAAARIVNATIGAFASGKIDEAGLRIALNFARTLGTVRGLSKEAGAEALEFFIQEVQDENLSDVGARKARELARGLREDTGISRQAAKELVRRFVRAAEEEAASAEEPGKETANRFGDGVRGRGSQVNLAGQETADEAVKGFATGRQGARAEGLLSGGAYAGGITARKEDIYQAAYEAALAGKKGFHDGSEGSPRYFTYYLGQDLVKELQAGVESERLRMGVRPAFEFPVTTELQGRIKANGDGNRKRSTVDVDVTIDRRNVAREIDWAWRAQGG